MKKVLLQIAAMQNAVIGTFENKTAGQLLANVAGADLGGTIPHAEYKTILQNINGFSKDRSRFKEDSTKIVIEKNLLVHVIKNLDGHFIFRGMDANNYLTIQTSAEFYKTVRMRVNKSDHRFLSYLMAALLLSAFITSMYLHSITGIVISVIVGMVVFFFHETIYRGKKEMHEGFAQRFNPEDLFARGYSDKSTVSIPLINGGHFDGELKCKLTINLTPELGAESGIDVWYRQTVCEMTILASKIKGEMAWLWKYRPESGLEIEDEVKFLANTPEIRIANYATRLLPVIETENSFIFYFPGLKGEELFEDIFDDEAYIKNQVNGIFMTFGEKLFLTASDFGRLVFKH